MLNIRVTEAGKGSTVEFTPNLENEFPSKLSTQSPEMEGHSSSSSPRTIDAGTSKIAKKVKKIRPGVVMDKDSFEAVWTKYAAAGDGHVIFKGEFLFPCYHLFQQRLSLF